MLTSTQLHFAHRLGGFALAGLLAACASTPLPPPTATAPSAVSSSLALAPDGAWLAAANLESGTLSLVDPARATVTAEVPVGAEPRAVAVVPDGDVVLAVTARAGELVWVDPATATVTGRLLLGGQPLAVVADGRRAYVSLFGAGQIAVVDLAARQVEALIAVEAAPAGLTLHQGALFVTHFYTGRVTRIDLSTRSPEPAITTASEANLALALVPSATDARAYLPLTLAHAEALTLTAETTVTPVVNVLDLATGRSTQLPLYVEANLVSLPVAAALSPDERWLFVASAGSDQLAVVATATGQLAGLFPVGAGPRAVVAANDRLYVHNGVDDTVTIVGVAYPSGTREAMPPLSHQATVSLTQSPLTPTEQLGKRLFNSAQPPLGAGWVACATCHFDGGHDGRTWLGFPDGPRNTPALFDLADTAPYHWSGDLDELQDVEFTIQRIQHGAGLLGAGLQPAQGAANAGRSAELDALAAYLRTFRAPPPLRLLDAAAQERGRKAFARWGCASCHSGPALTDGRAHLLSHDDIGDPALQRNPRGMRFDTPGLVGAWQTSPYFHDGSTATLRETLFRAGFHGMGWAMNPSEVDDVVAYLQSLP